MTNYRVGLSINSDPETVDDLNKANGVLLDYRPGTRLEAAMYAKKLNDKYEVRSDKNLWKYIVVTY